LPSLQRIIEGDQIEGEVACSWFSVPPLWLRIAIPIFYTVVISIWLYVSLKHLLSPLVSNSIMIAVGLAGMILFEIVPKEFVVTDKGIWVKRAGTFTDIKKSKLAYHRLIFWQQIFSIRRRKRKFIIRPRLPKETFFSTPTFLLKLTRRIALNLSKVNPEIEATIFQYATSALSEKTHSGDL